MCRSSVTPLQTRKRCAAPALSGKHPLQSQGGEDDAINEIEHQYLKELMIQTKAHIETACRIPAVRSRLYALLKKYNISY